MNFAEWIAAAQPYLRPFDRDHYREHFKTFEQNMDAWAELWARSEHYEAAREVLAQFEARWSRLGWRERSKAAFKDKQVLALFFSPAAARREDGAEAFAQELCREWNRRYPRNTYLVGSHDSIMKGFDDNLLSMLFRRRDR